MPKSYGGPWQEFRALIAVALMNLASSIHFRASMDVARVLVQIEIAEMDRRERA